jgi:hypothetical protein
MSNKWENVVDRLEEEFDFDRGQDLLSQLYFSTSYDSSGISIQLGDIILFYTADDGEYKPCDNTYKHMDNDQHETEFCNCTDCETNCQEWTEEDLYNLCVARLKTLSNALNLGTVDDSK